MITIGAVLRLRQFFSDRSLWLDEALLARNIIERSFVGLLQPLQYDQNAPVGFLMLSKLAVYVGGNNAYALRFFPLVFGILALFLFYRVARHFLKVPGTLIALTFFSLSTPMVYYSAEFKQYMGDVCVTLMLWYFFLVSRPKNKIWLAVIGVIVLWFSHASMFVLAGLGLSDLSLWRYAVPLWIASFGLNYFISLQHNLSEVVIQKWSGLFLRFPWQTDESPAVFVATLNRMFGFFLDVENPIVHFILLLLGYAGIARKHVKNIIVFGLPVVLLLIATGFQKYPFVPRLLLFLAPSLYIGIGVGTDVLIGWGRRFGKRLGVILVILILVPILLWGVIPSAANALVVPIKVEELEQVLAFLHKNYKPGDVLYLYYAAESPFRFYAPKFGLDKAQTVVGISSRSDVTKYIEDVAKLKGNPRVWVVFSHIYRQSLFGEDRYIVGYLDDIGKRLDYYPQVGASLYLYDLR